MKTKNENANQTPPKFYKTLVAMIILETTSCVVHLLAIFISIGTYIAIKINQQMNIIKYFKIFSQKNSEYIRPQIFKKKDSKYVLQKEN